MPFRVIAVPALTVPMVLLAGCDSSSPPPSSADSATWSSGDSHADSGAESALRDAPEVGTCRAVPAGKALSHRYWFDDSPVVPCSEPHTTETVLVVELDSPTPKQASDFDQVCWDKARNYVASDATAWIPWTEAEYLPSKEQIANGASWFRCDVTLAADTPYRHPRSLLESVENAAVERGDQLLPCLNDDPRSRQVQPILPCSKPHHYESTGTLAIINDVTAYPSPARLRKEGATQCRSGLTPKQLRELDSLAIWDQPEAFSGGDIAATCWLYRTDGTLMPPRL